METLKQLEREVVQNNLTLTEIEMVSIDSVTNDSKKCVVDTIDLLSDDTAEEKIIEVEYNPILNEQETKMENFNLETVKVETVFDNQDMYTDALATMTDLEPGTRIPKVEFEDKRDFVVKQPKTVSDDDSDDVSDEDDDTLFKTEYADTENDSNHSDTAASTSDEELNDLIGRARQIINNYKDTREEAILFNLRKEYESQENNEKKLKLQKLRDELKQYEITVKELDHDEMVTAMEAKKNDPRYQKASYRCELCCLVFKVEETLDMHTRNSHDPVSKDNNQ